MRALIPIIIAAVALAAAGCGATSTGLSDKDRAFISSVQASKQRLNTLSARIDANQLEDEADLDAYLRDMRSAADEMDTLSGTVGGFTSLEEARDELSGYAKQLGTTAGLARKVASAVEEGDEKEIDRAQTAYMKAATRLLTVQQTAADALQPS
jgi:hypothetical protein